jgi:mannosidase alpha-like ER degradation enhancer 2
MFNSPTGLPYVNVNLKTGAVSGVDSNPAEVGSYLFEFGTLSKLTGKPVYYTIAKKAAIALYDRRSSIGLVSGGINIETGKWTATESHVGACIDSYYEYLLKCAVLFGDPDCRRMWESTIAAVNKYVADDTPNGFWYGVADMNTGARGETGFGALNAFFPAVLTLSGDVDRAERLEESCYKMWTLNGIEPELIDYSSMKVISPGYPLRPEIIESAYYLYFFTGKTRYLDMGQTFFDDLVRYCRTDAAYTSLINVVTKEKADDMESFFFAETLKYLYVLYAPRKTLDLNKVVLNTEAHPIRRFAAEKN